MSAKHQRSVVDLAERRAEVAAAGSAAATAAFDQQLLTVEQAAVEVSVSVNTIRRAYTFGHLKVVRFGRYPGSTRGLRIKRGEVLRWMEAGGKTGRPDQI